MRNRLDQLLSETFEYKTSSPVLTPEQLVLEADRDASVQGILHISHPERRRLRGFVYPSDPRLTAEQTDFSGTDVQIRWHADLTGLPAGAVLEGDFTFCTDLGEVRVPCRIAVKQEEAEQEPVTLDALAELAQRDFPAAEALYTSSAFAASVQREDCEVRTLYEALKGEQMPAHALEEFLLGLGRKEQVELTLSEETHRIADPAGTVLEEVTLTKNTWGWLELEITSDARFLRVEKHHVTTEDFVGSSWPLRYIIDANFLHAGRNFGRITVRTCYQTLEYEVLVERRGTADLRQHRVRSLMVRKAYDLYLDYRLGRIDMHRWIEHTRSVTGGYRRAGGTSVRAELLEVFLLQTEGKRASSERELNRIRRSGALEQDVEAEAAWLYLSTFLTRDTDYINQVRGRVRQLCLQLRSSWIVRWISLYLLEDEMGGPAGKLDAILRQLENGPASPILCLEGARLVAENPFLLHEWTGGARMIVQFAVREGLAGERLLLHMTSLVRRRGGYDPVTFRLLGKCWETSHLDDVLEVWVQMAIAGGKTDEKYFPLYQTAVSRELRVTGLYEYYMETMGEVRIETMPQIIRRYFVLNDRLDWRKKARIYRNLSDNRANIPQIFSSMLPSIEKFVTDQLQMTRINEDMAVLYERYLTRQVLTPALAKKLVRLLFTFRVDCLSPQIAQVIVTDVRQRRERVAELKDHSAQVQIYSEQSRILLEDREGNRYASSSLYMAQHLLDAPALMGLCAQLVPDEPHLVLFFTLNPTTLHQPITHKTLDFYRSAEALAGLSEEYRTQVRRWLLTYYAEHPGEETLGAFLRRADLDAYAAIDRRKLLGLLTQEGMYEEAWAELERGGHEGVDLAHLVRICAQMVLNREYEEDAALLARCGVCFRAGKVEEHILAYLLMYYEGPVEQMKSLWNAGREYGLDTINLEKRILSMILFSRRGSGGSESIYLSYRRSMGNRRLCRAYVILRCYEYLVKEMPVADSLFEDVEESARKEETLPDVCALALLKHLSAAAQRTKEQDRIAAELLQRYGSRGIRFAFFQKFPLHLRPALGLEDKVLLECVADPASSVKLFYRLRGQEAPFTEEPMRDVFEGIRVREFVLFPGEELECYTEETAQDGKKLRSGHRFLKAGQVPEELQESRFGRITKMTQLEKAGDMAALSDEVYDYRQMEALTKELFTLMV